VTHESVAQTCRQICGTYSLRSANTGPTGSARVAIGHVRRRFFPVRQYALDRHVIHLSQSPAQHGGNEKESGYPLCIQKFRDKPATRHLWQSLLSMKNPNFLV
jgi:hypothetical protein